MSAVAVLRTVAANELAQVRSLARWVARRPDVPPGAEPSSYVGAVAALLWAFIVGSAIELVVLHVILRPWETVRLVVDVLSVWGLLWMLGLAASLTVRPHLLTDAGLRVRYGNTVDLTVPCDAVASVSVRTRNREKSRALQVDEAEDGADGPVVNVVVAKQTNVDVVLRRPLVLPGVADGRAVLAVRLYADDPRPLVASVRARSAGVEERRT